jgi:hypothetical protein
MEDLFTQFKEDFPRLNIDDLFQACHVNKLKKGKIGRNIYIVNTNNEFKDGNHDCPEGSRFEASIKFIYDNIMCELVIIGGYGIENEISEYYTDTFKEYFEQVQENRRSYDTTRTFLYKQIEKYKESNKRISEECENINKECQKFKEELKELKEQLGENLKTKEKLHEIKMLNDRFAILEKE